jgi:small-conductance mechanosensitive channel
MALSTLTLNNLLIAIAVFTGVTAVAFGIRQLALRALHRWGISRASPMDQVIIGSLWVPSLLWCFLLGLYVGVELAPLPPRPTLLVLNVVYSLMVLSVTAALANLAAAMLRQGLAKAHLAIPATGVSVASVKVAIWLVGGLVLLAGLGISITPVLTALGVGGLAVALALQDTLSNFFAGLHLLIEKPIKVGDFVKLETGQEGYVMDIGWRTTRIRMLPNNMVILPNSTLTRSVLTNYSLPTPQIGMTIRISVSYRSDPDHVERMVMEEARAAIGKVPGLMADPEPSVRLLPGFGESSLDFTLACRVNQFEDQALVEHELRKRIFKRFKQEGIEIPFPQRTVHLENGEAPRISSQEHPS